MSDVWATSLHNPCFAVYAEFCGGAGPSAGRIGPTTHLDA